jgi:hypothetical protein
MMLRCSCMFVKSSRICLRLHSFLGRIMATRSADDDTSAAAAKFRAAASAAAGRRLCQLARSRAKPCL